MAVGNSNSVTVTDVFTEFMGRRSALVKAVTTDAKTLYTRCHPERDNLCLYGFPNGKWEVKAPPPKELYPSTFPEPTVGINFARFGLETKWLYLVAMHSDCWLLATIFHSAAYNGFHKEDRERLFTMINDLPTIVEVLTEEAAKKQPKKNSESTHSGKKSKPGSVRGGSQSGNYSKKSRVKDKDKLDKEDHDRHGKTFCGICGQSKTSEAFSICCNTCEKWFHWNCVTVSPSVAEHMQKYGCSSCRNRARA